MYEKTKLSVRLPSGITEFFPSNVGLKQGCNMSPILFNLFVSNINEIFDVCFCQLVSLGNIKLSNLLYADDLILISETKTGLQSCLDNLQEYYQKWKLRSTIKRQKSWLWKKDNPQLKYIVSVYKKNHLKFVNSIHTLEPLKLTLGIPK